MSCYRNAVEIIENLMDAGCNRETVSEFMDCVTEKNRLQELEILSAHREKLLKEIHQMQSCREKLETMIKECRI